MVIPSRLSTSLVLEIDSRYDFDMPKIRASATQFEFRTLREPDEFWQRIEDLIKKASAEDSQLILFPEYFSLPWLLSLCGQNFSEALDKFDDVKVDFHQRFEALAKQHQMIIVAGSTPVFMRVRRVNRAFVYLPDGRRFEQDKQHMTRIESEAWKFSSGHPNIRFWEWKGAGLGVAISYDIEFPAYTRELTKKDVDIILIPSCTTDIHGYWRVRHCAQARAVESQTYVVMSSLFGTSLPLPEKPAAYGRAGFFTPCDTLFPEEGVLGLGALNQEGVTTHLLDVGLLHKVREEGTVLNRKEIF